MNGFVWTFTTVAAVAQVDGINVDVGTPVGLVGGAIGAFLTTLVIGAILIAIAPDYTDRMTDVVLDDPIGSFIYGLLALLAVIILTVLFAITIIGIFVAIPLAIAAYLVWAIGSVFAYLAIGERLVGRGDGWLKPLLVGAGINGLLTLTGIGGLIAFAIGATGFGTVLRTYFE
ncbi:hypothetical protein [Halosolutus gelatinilyticus]|uniref:hypothetical protein n=1 Tax=Halosolutus gelatinilyticus TaxID=2931975 RepID=UPI001FF4D4A9|nr:hypothetical protein [Halosolutus gelatinilyticus]